MSRPDDPLGDTDAYYAMMLGRLPESDRRIVERLEAVKTVYVECGRDKALRQAFDTFLRNHIARRGGKPDEAEVFFLTGESGAGKSAAVQRLLASHEMMQPITGSFGTISPYVSIKLRGFTIPRIAGRAIITEAGYPIRNDTQRGEIWDVMAARLKGRGVMLVHIDETQHLIKKNASQSDREALSDAIKGVTIDRDWPVAFLLSGLPRVMKLPIGDEQFERRSAAAIHFTDIDMPNEKKLVIRILRKMAEAGGLAVDGLTETDLSDRLAHAANYRYARICQVVSAAIHAALAADPTTDRLTRLDFAKAYATRSHALGRNEMNPFVADQWQRLKPGSFMIDADGD